MIVKFRLYGKIVVILTPNIVLFYLHSDTPQLLTTLDAIRKYMRVSLIHDKLEDSSRTTNDY